MQKNNKPVALAVLRDSSGLLRLGGGVESSSQCRGDPRSLLDRALGIEFGGDIGATDQGGRVCRGGASSSRRDSWPAQTTMVSTGSVFASPLTVMCRPASSMRSVHAGDHRHPALSSAACGGSSRWSCQPVADLARLALEQEHLARGLSSTAGFRPPRWS